MKVKDPMKIAITAAVLSFILALPAGAAPYQSPALKQAPASQDLYACARGPVNRVALSAPAPCCAGQMVCSQFLSTTTMVRGGPEART